MYLEYIHKYKNLNAQEQSLEVQSKNLNGKNWVKRFQNKIPENIFKIHFK